MIEFIQNFHFLRPWALLLLLIPLGFYLKKVGFATQLSSWKNICDKKLLDFLLINNSNRKHISVRKYIYTGLIAAVLACAGPCWKKTEIPSLVVENPVMFVLSLAQDMQLKDISPSRLDRAKFMISDIADKLSNGQFGLEVYSQEPYIITPISDDIKLVKNLLPQIVPDIVPDQGDRLDRAIELAVQKFKSANYSSGNIILFASDIGQRFDLALEITKEAAKSNYVVNIIDTSFSGNDKLQTLAQNGKGLYLSIKETNPQRLIQRINDLTQEKTILSQNLRSDYIDYGYYLVFVCLFCMLPFFRKGLFILFLFCSFSLQAQAGFLSNNNQDGLHYFKQNNLDMALEKFDDATWRGVVLYKKEDLEKALTEFEKNKTDIDLYNKGVVLTKLCKYQEAFDAFGEALKINPENEDAQYNKNILFDLLEKAKDDPSLLSCDNNKDNNNQEQNKESNQNQQQDKNNSQDNSQKNDEGNSSDNEQENSQNEQQENKNSEDDDKNQQQESSSQEQKEDNQNQENDGGENNNPNSGSDQDNSSAGPKDDSEQNSEDRNSPSKADNDNGEQNKTNNKNGDSNNGSEMQQEQVDAQLMNAKKGDDDTSYDEEALAIQRRYREIPEDVGGLLRQFIRKEYMKDRYHDEK